MTIKTASAKQKGRKLQQWVRDKLLELHPELEPDDIKSTAMGQSGSDIQLSPLARKRIPLAFECKSHKAFSVYKILEQAKDGAHPDCEPVAILKQDRSKPLALVDAEFFLEALYAAR